MKKILILTLFAVAFVAFGCGGTQQAAAPVAPVNQCMVGAPAWVMMGGDDAMGFTSTGNAQPTKAGFQQQRTTAMANARTEMGNMIGVRVDSMVKEFTGVTGIGDDETVDRVASQVSRQVSSQTLQGTRQAGMWQSPCGDLWILLSADPKMVQNYVRDSVSSSFRNERALWQQFQAQNAQDELNAALQSQFPAQ